MTRRRSKGTRNLLEDMGDLGDFASTISEITGRGVKVVEIVLDRIRPDPAQPRRVLPRLIREEFLNGRINARQALERWEAVVAEEANGRGRPRPDWQSLLARDPDDQGDDTTVDPPGEPGPEEGLLRAIVATAATIRHGGQVSPITVIEVDGGSYYRIETGERRYWAHHWLNTWVSDNFDQIQALVIEAASPWRQAAENTSREGLSAMAMARQLATLLLDLYGIHPDYSAPISNDWYRQALNRRVPRGNGENLRAALGGLGRSQFSRLQALLALPDAVWEIADRFRIEEKRLRYLLKIEDEMLQLQLMRDMVLYDYPAERVKEIVDRGEYLPIEEYEALAEEEAARRAMEVADARPPDVAASDAFVSRWPRLARDVPKADLVRTAEQWVNRENPEDLRRQIDLLRKLLNYVERHLDALGE